MMLMGLLSLTDTVVNATLYVVIVDACVDGVDACVDGVVLLIMLCLCCCS